MSDELSFSVIINIVKKRLKIIGVLVVFAAIVSAFFSGPRFIKPQYKSRAVIYPSNLSPYGEESNAEQMLQLLYATNIKDSLIVKYDLYKRYLIDTISSSSRFFINRTISQRISFNETKYESIEIEVMDENPDTAKLMVDEIIIQLNLQARNMHREKYAEVVEINFNEMEKQRVRVDSMEARLQYLRINHGILDYMVQTEEILKGYMKMLANNTNVTNRKKAEDILNNLYLKGGEYKKLNRLADLTRDKYFSLNHQYEDALKEFTKELTYTNMVVKPEVADKKSYPVRWVIVFSAMVFTLVAALAVFIPLDRSKI
ncbi:MAG: capsular polysaccharide biosynthesis protein [Flavobacteriales bacterium]|jgi:capsular polysaccharide biosynthesis protein